MPSPWTKPIDWWKLVAVTLVSVLIALFGHFYWSSDWFEVAAFVTGVVYVYLAALEHVANWPLSIVNSLIYAWVFFQGKLLASASLSILYFFLSIHGWWAWVRGGEGHTELHISRMTPLKWVLALASTIIGTALYKPVVDRLDGAQSLADTTLSVGSVVTQVMLNYKFIENWTLWIFINLAYIPVYYVQHLYLTVVFYIILLALSVQGLVLWKRTLNQAVLA